MQFLTGATVVRLPRPISTIFHQLRGRIWPDTTLVPDEQMIWATKASEYVNRHYSKAQLDALITFGHPWSDHLAGLAIKRRIELPWVAHFSDPWADNPYYKKFNTRQLGEMAKLEAMVVESADGLVFTNQPTLDLVMRKYPKAWSRKATVVPHGYDRNIKINPPEGQDRSRMRVVHTGNLYGLRSPLGLLQALSLLRKEYGITREFDVQLIGRTKNMTKWNKFVKKHKLTEMVTFRQQVPYVKSLEYAASADVLLLIDAPNDSESVFLPSKLVDYLGFNKPILGLTPYRGVSAEILRDLGCPVVSPTDPAQIAQGLIEQLASWQSGSVELGSHFANVAAAYDIHKTIIPLERILLNVSES